MCGRVIQSSGLIRYAIDEGIDVPNNRVHNTEVEDNKWPA
jgi:hypothetical protein